MCESQDPLGLSFLEVSCAGKDDFYEVLGISSVLPSSVNTVCLVETLVSY